MYSRTTLIRRRLENRGTRRVVMGGARVGSDSVVGEHILRTDNAINITNDDTKKWVAATQGFLKSRAITPEEQAVDNFIGTAVSKPAPTFFDPDAKIWVGTGVWGSFYARWHNYVNTKPDASIISNDAEVTKYDSELADNRKTFSELASKTQAGDTITTPIPSPQPGDQSGGAGNPLSSISKTVTDVIWVAGIGLLVYIGMLFVLPALFGAAASTKSAARSLKES